MSQVGQSGSTQNTPVDYSSKTGTAGEAESLDRVSAGTLDQENIRFADQHTRNEILRGQQVRAPVLDVPEDVQPTAFESASSDIGDVSELTDKVLKSTGALIQNGLNDELDPQQQQRLKQHENTLRGTSNYLNALHGNNLGAEGKRSVLAGLGYNMSQLEALLSLADPDDAGNGLISLHGASLQGKKDALVSLGFSESQVEALLSLADPDDSGNSLASLRQAGSDVKAALQTLGFTATQAERLQALLNGQPSAGSAEQKQLLIQMGFSEEAAEIVLTNANPAAVRQQDALIRGTGSEQIAQLQKLAQATSVFTTEGSTNSAGVLEQLADIFMVLELLHEMAVQSRRTSREYRSAQYDAAKQEILNQVDEMKKAAVHTLVAGVVSGAAKIGAGAVSAAGAFGGAKAKTPAGADATAQSQAQSAAMQQSIQRATAVSQMVQGAGDMAAAGFNYQATQHSAKQKQHEAFQKTHENAAQSASEFMQLHQDMVKTVQSKMDEIIRTWFETLKSTNRI